MTFHFLFSLWWGLFITVHCISSAGMSYRKAINSVCLQSSCLWPNAANRRRKLRTQPGLWPWFVQLTPRRHVRHHQLSCEEKLSATTRRSNCRRINKPGAHSFLWSVAHEVQTDRLPGYETTSVICVRNIRYPDNRQPIQNSINKSVFSVSCDSAASQCVC